MPLSARSVRVAPLTDATWADLERLFGAKGAHGGCWCTYYRIPRESFMRTRAADRKALLRRATRQGPPPGLLAYVKGEPVAWVAIAPREETPVLDPSRVTASPDGRPSWAITCFFVAPEHRGQGMMRKARRSWKPIPAHLESSRGARATSASARRSRRPASRRSRSPRSSACTSAK